MEYICRYGIYVYYRDVDGNVYVETPDGLPVDCYPQEEEEVLSDEEKPF